MKTEKPIPNRYIVVLDDDIVPDNLPREEKREQVAAIANGQAQPHGGRVDYIYESALKGYSTELPNEAAAIAISNMPEVRWVEEVSLGESTQAPPSPQPSPPWGLDSLDSGLPAPSPNPTTGLTSGLYGYGANGTGVSAYVIDSGINTAHVEFLTPFFSRAVQAADCFTFVNCVSGQMTPYFNQQACVFPMPNATNNDCFGHGTHVAGVLGGNNYGVAKNVTIRAVKVGFNSFLGGYPLDAAIAGVNWVRDDHLANPSTPAVANMSLAFGTSLGLEVAVSNALAVGVTFVTSAGNSNTDARNQAPADVTDALTVGAVDWNGVRPTFSNWGPGVDLFAPGVSVVSAQSGNGVCLIWNGSNTSFCISSGTSFAAPHVAGAVAMYLQGRGAITSCSAIPIQGSAPATANVSTCPDRVSRYIKANARLNLLSNIDGTINVGGIPVIVPSPNRFLSTSALPSPTNPIDNNPFFIWGLYADFFNREPDNGGMLFYINMLNGCLGDIECIKATRGIQSANFFRSPEFGQKGAYLENLFNIVFGQRPKTVAELSDPAKVERPHYAEFVNDLQTLNGTTDALVNLQKSQLASTWMGRSEVLAILPNSLTNQQFVQKLKDTAGLLTLANESTLIANLNSGASRASVLRAVAESSEVTTKFTLQNFVTTQYIAHLRREPEDCHGSLDPANCGYIFHYNRFGTGGDPAAIENLITRGFIESPEYRRRFGLN